MHATSLSDCCRRVFRHWPWPLRRSTWVCARICATFFVWFVIWQTNAHDVVSCCCCDCVRFTSVILCSSFDGRGYLLSVPTSNVITVVDHHWSLKKPRVHDNQMWEIKVNYYFGLSNNSASLFTFKFTCILSRLLPSSLISQQFHSFVILLFSCYYHFRCSSETNCSPTDRLKACENKLSD